MCEECIPVSNELTHLLSLVFLCKLALSLGRGQSGQKYPHLSDENEDQSGFKVIEHFSGIAGILLQFCLTVQPFCSVDCALMNEGFWENRYFVLVIITK